MDMLNALRFILIGYVATTSWVSTNTLASTDPCTSYSELPRAEYRGGQCLFNPDKAVCDRTLTSGWYRAVGRNGDLQMQETNATFGTCGTKFPFWMNGTHPTVADGEVLREVCMASVISLCDDRQPISVKNCGDFYVYRLDSTGSCPIGYCFGETDDCPPFDPCDAYENVRVDYDPGRSSVCNQHGNTSCDNFDPNTWYSFRNPLFGYLNVTTQCPPDRHACGTQHALFINRTNPDTVDDDGSFETEVCEQHYPTCCGRRFNIRSKECKGFMVYKFPIPHTTTCHRYCLDYMSATCPTTTTPTTTTSTTTSSTTKSTSQGSPDQAKPTGKNEAPVPSKQLNDNDKKQNVWIIVVVACVAMIVTAFVAIVVVRMVLPKHRSSVDYAEKPPPPYTKEQASLDDVTRYYSK